MDAPAPGIFQQRTRVLHRECLARDTYLVRLEAPRIAAAIRPGQFVMLRWPSGADPLLGRPFALYDTVLDASGAPTGLDIVFLVVGKLTRLLADARAGTAIEVWGPLGNGFPEPQGGGNVGLVAGGIGQTPFLAHVRELLGTRGYGGAAPRQRVDSVSLFYGMRSANLAAGVEDFQQAGAAVHLASNDGSIGHHGFVTDLLERDLLEREAQASRAGHLFGCGPEPMLRALARLALRRQLPCHLSLETPMACGVGICFSCVTPVKTGAGWDYKRVCVDGPVFDARTLHWPE